jgi:hypothetical protein
VTIHCGPAALGSDWLPSELQVLLNFTAGFALPLVEWHYFTPYTRLISAYHGLSA